jgi:hypothetical protein
MEFEFTEEQKAIANTAREIAQDFRLSIGERRRRRASSQRSSSGP